MILNIIKAEAQKVQTLERNTEMRRIQALLNEAEEIIKSTEKPLQGMVDLRNRLKTKLQFIE